MIETKFSEFVYDEKDIFDLIMSDNQITIHNMLIDKTINFDPNLELINIPELKVHVPAPNNQTIEEFDEIKQQNWFMPDYYKTFDIAQFVLDQCKTDAELQRAGQELIMYQDRNLFMLLRYLKYLVDTMRKNNIVWGVGRGSSVSSYVLYKIGIHRIDSLFYDLDIADFLR